MFGEGFQLEFGLGEEIFTQGEQALGVVIEKVFFLKQQIEMFFADGVAPRAARQGDGVREMSAKSVIALFAFSMAALQSVRVDCRGLHFRMLRQAVEKADAAFGAFERILRPKLGRIGIFTV